MPSPDSARTCAEFIRAVAAAYGDRPAVTLDEEVLTYRQLEERSRRRAEGLILRGVGKGSRVGILFSNSPEWVVSWAAVTRIGAVAVSLSTFLKPPELARVVRHADLHGLIAQPRFLGQDFLSNLETAFPELGGSSADLFLADAPYLRWITVACDHGPDWSHNLAWLDAAVEGGRFDALLSAAEMEIDPEDPAVVIYTSGQSAMPKGVWHSHATVTGKTHYLRSMFLPVPGETSVASMPFFWVGGLALQLLCILEVGGVVECADKGTSGGVLMGMRAPVSYSRSGPASALGMSESFASYSWGTEPPHDDHPLCVPMTRFDPEIEVKVVDADGRPTGEGQRGEIVIRGRGVTTGLQKVRRSDAFDQDGFYRTGDQALIHEGGICFVGRLGDMIKSAGANVAPAEVEYELLQLPGVSGAHVVAVDVAGRGHVVGAAVVPAPGATLQAVQVSANLRERLSTYKVPRLIAFVGVDELPMTPSRKIDKRRLAALIVERAAGEAL